METKQELAEKKSGRKKPQRHDVKILCAAVLSVWSESRRPTQVCRDLGINWAVLSGWQNRALEGMLRALAPKPDRAEKPLALNPGLEQRLARKMAMTTAKAGRLQQRLKAVETASPSPEKPKE